MVIRGAPAIGVAAAMGVALGVQEDAGFRDRFATRWRPRGPRRSICSGPSTACAVCALRSTEPSREAFVARMMKKRSQIRAGRYRHLPRHRPPRRAAGAGRQDRADALQRRRAGDRRIRHRAGRDPRGRRSRQEDRRVRRRDPAVPARRAADGVGTAAGRHPRHLITDNMAGHFLHSGRIGCVVVGADRIAANGDVANKIGTYSRGGAGEGERRAVLRGRAGLHARSHAGLRRRRFPSSSAPRPR